VETLYQSTGNWAKRLIAYQAPEGRIKRLNALSGNGRPDKASKRFIWLRRAGHCVLEPFHAPDDWAKRLNALSGLGRPGKASKHLIRPRRAGLTV